MIRDNRDRNAQIITPYSKLNLIHICSFRIIVDGPGAATLFSGHKPCFDELYTLTNHYISGKISHDIYENWYYNKTNNLMGSFVLSTQSAKMVACPVLNVGVQISNSKVRYSLKHPFSVLLVYIYLLSYDQQCKLSNYANNLICIFMNINKKKLQMSRKS